MPPLLYEEYFVSWISFCDALFCLCSQTCSRLFSLHLFVLSNISYSNKLDLTWLELLFYKYNLEFNWPLKVTVARKFVLLSRDTQNYIRNERKYAICTVLPLVYITKPWKRILFDLIWEIIYNKRISQMGASLATDRESAGTEQTAKGSICFWTQNVIYSNRCSTHPNRGILMHR